MTLDELKQEYGVNNPIFLSDITTDENYQAVRKYLSRMVVEGKIKRFCRGVYYFSRKTIFGDSVLTPCQVYVKRYMENSGKIFGFYAGPNLINLAGLTTQMSNSVEIYSNNATAIKRVIQLDGYPIILRKARTQINNENVNVLQFLELINILDTQTIKSKRQAIIFYAQKNRINRNAILSYLNIYPASVSKKIIELGDFK